ncbi:Protein transport protein Sec61 subunit gamma [Smittium culicis]|uniref:Protein transport protein Sec61 subunit gamma n=1 Tax=Smittium culicis TaxID=133412 RepID=A0A1R1X9F8_9FUNG|nr:Protein transport protein Sec61 subunit gamma [Smittium culicis]
MENQGEENIFISVPKNLVKDSIWLINKCTKPNKKEYQQIVFAVSLGFLIMGFSGYFVKLVHIPITNIIVGGA